MKFKTILLITLIPLAGCDRDDVVVREQRAPKQQLRVLASAAPTTAEASPIPSASAAPSSADFTYTTPTDWIKDGPMPMRHLSFHIGDKASQADVIITRLPSTAFGSFVANVNRWRSEVGLPPIKEGDPQPSSKIEVGGIESALFDFTGPDKRSFVAVVPAGTDFWFFKLRGPSDVVAKQQSAFDAFLKSVKFTADKP